MARRFSNHGIRILFTELLLTHCAEQGQAQKSAADIYRDNREAVVLVQGAGKTGSGFLISQDGKVVTNYHVVSGEKSVSVRLATGLELETDDVVAQDPRL